MSTSPSPVPEALKIPLIDSIANTELESMLHRRFDTRVKPVDSLGMLEKIAIQVGLIQGTTLPLLETAEVVVFAGDHGLVDEGISSYPQSATLHTVQHMLKGGGATNVLSRQFSSPLTIVDAGIASALADVPEEIEQIDLEERHRPRLQKRKIGHGTRNMLRGPAMTPAQAMSAIHAGMDVAKHLSGQAIIIGEIGVGSSASASLLLSKICGVPLDDAVGVSPHTSASQRAATLRVLNEVNKKHIKAQSAFACLTSVGGFEIAMMVGAMLQAASDRKVILVDGFVPGAAALIARAICPASIEYMVFGHRSSDSAHRILLIHLQATPVLDLEIRLGEGIGAIMAWPVLRSAVNLMNEMASYASKTSSEHSNNSKPVPIAFPTH